MSLVTELRKVRLSEKEIVSLGKAISGGFGFWGHEIRRTKKKDIADRAWVKALREKGLKDVDIALFGDWRIARHIGDRLTWDDITSVEKAVEAIKKDARHESVSVIRNVNKDEYDNSRKLLSWVKRNKPKVLEKVK